LSCRWAPLERVWPHPPDPHPADICKHKYFLKYFHLKRGGKPGFVNEHEVIYWCTTGVYLHIKSPEPKQAEPLGHLVPPRRTARLGPHAASSLLAGLRLPLCPLWLGQHRLSPGPGSGSGTQITSPARHSARREKIQQWRGGDGPSYRCLSTEALPLAEFGADLT